MTAWELEKRHLKYREICGRGVRKSNKLMKLRHKEKAMGKTNRNLNERDSNARWPTSDSDRPKESISQDKLGRKELRNTIARTILRYSSKESLIIGIYGSWGIGKTTILNFIIEYIEKVKDKSPNKLKDNIPDIVYFDPWIFANQEEITRRFLETLLKRLGKIKNYETIVENLQGMLDRVNLVKSIISNTNIKLVAIIIAIWGLSDSLIDVIKNDSFPLLGTTILLIALLILLSEQVLVYFINKLNRKLLKPSKLDDLRENLKKELGSFNKKLIIIIDEIDRLNKEETKIVFQFVKSTFNLPNVIFLLAFDKSQVSKLISHKGFVGSEYIEKIVQTPFPIPPPDRAALERFIDLQLNRVIYFLPDSSFDKTRWSQLYVFSGLRNILLTDNNPRKIIRFCNFVKGHLYVLQNAVDPIDFLGIRTIEYFYKDIYSFLENNVSELVEDTEENIRMIFETKDHRQLFKEELDIKAKGDIRNLVDYLFPSITANHDDSIVNEWVRKKRICSWRNIHNYFYMKRAEDAIKHQELERFTMESKAVDELEVILIDKISDDSIQVFLRDLARYIELIPAKNIRNLMICLFNIVDRFPAKYHEYWVSPYNVATQIVRKILRKIGKTESLNALNDCINNANGLSLPFSLVDSWEKNIMEGQGYEIEVEENVISLLKLNLVSRAETLSESGELRNADYLGFILNKWKEWSKEDYKIKSFVDSSINDESFMPAFITHYVLSKTRTETSGSNREYMFDFEALGNFGTNLGKLYNKVQTVLSRYNTALTKDHLRALKLYRMDFPKYNKAKKNPDKYYRDDQII